MAGERIADDQLLDGEGFGDVPLRKCARDRLRDAEIGERHDDVCSFVGDSGEIQRPLNAKQRTEGTEPLGGQKAGPDLSTVAARGPLSEAGPVPDSNLSPVNRLTTALHRRRWSAGVTAVIACVFQLLLIADVGAVGADPAAPVASHARVESAIRDCANRNRRAVGLEPLQAGQVLSRAARLQARNMAREHFFDHTDRQGRGPQERVEIFDREHRYTLVGENIAAGYGSAAAACEGWMKSPGHRANILGQDYTAIGTGFFRGGDYGRYYVQVFAKELLHRYHQRQLQPLEVTVDLAEAGFAQPIHLGR